MTKCCGYSELIILPKYSKISDLLQLLELQMGLNIHNKTYFYDTKSDVDMHEKIYINTISHETPLSVVVKKLRFAYNVNECNHSVYQLYYDSGCECVH